MFGYPYTHAPEAPALRPSWLPRPEMLGFESKALSCVSCGARVDIGSGELARFLAERGSHIRAFLEGGRMPRKPTWRAAQ